MAYLCLSGFRSPLQSVDELENTNWLFLYVGHIEYHIRVHMGLLEYQIRQVGKIYLKIPTYPVKDN